MPNIIGLDLVTPTVTGVLLDTERETVLHLAQRLNDSAIKSALPTRAEQDPQHLQALASEVLAELAPAGRPVDGIALTQHPVRCTVP